MSIKKIGLFALLVFCNQAMYSFVLSGECWEYGKSVVSSECSSIKTILLLYDSHKKWKFNRKHLKELLHYLRTKGPQISFIAEDPDTLNDNKLSLFQLYQYRHTDDVPLCSSVSLAHHCNVLATSVEFRPNTLTFKSQIFIGDVVKTTKEQITKLSEYDDGPLLNAEYKKYSKRYYLELEPKSKQLFKNIENQGCDLKNINYEQLEFPEEANLVISLYNPSCNLENYDKRQLVKEFITCYAKEAIDCNILHALAEHAKQGVSTAVIYAGGAHINRIKPVLAKLGYHLCKYAHAHEVAGDIDSPLILSKALQELDSSYNPDDQLPMIAVDHLFAYQEWEEKHDMLRRIVPTKMIAFIAGYLYSYQQWKEEYSILQAVIPATMAMTALSVLCCIIKVCSSS